MATREEIEEGMGLIHMGRCPYPDDAMPCEGEGTNNEKCLDCIMRWLDSQGVVIEVKGELPHKIPLIPNNEWSAGYCCGEEFMQDVMVESGYVAVEPLIKEVK